MKTNRWRGRAGQSLVEMAMVLPVLAFLTFGLVATDHNDCCAHLRQSHCSCFTDAGIGTCYYADFSLHACIQCWHLVLPFMCLSNILFSHTLLRIAYITSLSF